VYAWRRHRRVAAAALQHADEAIPPSQTEMKISHVVPALELHGTLEQKLRRLNEAIGHLEQLRCRLTGESQAYTAAVRRTLRSEAPEWPWIAVGILIALLPVLALLVRASG
jgi:hypothetical protein